MDRFRFLLCVIFVLFTFCVLFSQPLKGHRQIKAPRKNSKHQQKRNFIIKCCGKSSCVNVLPKRARQSSTQMNNLSSKKNSTVEITSGTSAGEILFQTTSNYADKASDSTQQSVETTEQNIPLATSDQEKGTETILIPPESVTDHIVASSTDFPIIQKTSTLAKQSLKTTHSSFTITQAATISASLPPTERPTTTTRAAILTTWMMPTSTISTMNLSTHTTITSSSADISSNTKVLTTTIDPNIKIYDCLENTCKKNESLFYKDGRLIDANDYGYWNEACGILYLWGKSVVDWQTNYNKCCSLGMMPIALENDTKKECLDNLSKPSVWKYNSNYWTAARKTRTNGTFQWCSPNQTNSDSKFDNSSSYWLPGQPNNFNGENCVHLQVNKSIGRMYLTDKNCSNFYVFGCQGKPTPSPPCFSPKCPTFGCDKTTSFFSTLPDGKTQYLTKPINHGFWYTINGRTYVFSSVKQTWLDAAKACCAIGMKILSIEFDYEYTNLIAAAKNSSNAEGIFWTSGSDEGCEGNFGWCAVNKLVRSQEAKWYPGEPNNYNGKENCIYLKLGKTGGTLYDADCSTSQMYICEARDTTKTTSSSEAMVDECGAAFNVSRDEAKQIFNTTKYSLKIKCFLKCMGENGGFMLNGKLVDESILMMAESMAANAAKMQENMIAVSTCSSKKGMDECDTASLVFQCGQENAPELVANIINTVELNTSSEAVPLRGLVPKCPTEYDCVLDPQMRDDYLNNRAVANNGTIFTACGVKYMIQFDKVSYEAAASLCCKYGLKLASFSSPSELLCLVNKSMSTLPVVESHAWLAASRLGVANYAWCSSSSPFNLMPTISDHYPERSSMPDWFLISVRFVVETQPTDIYIAQERTASRLLPFCKP
ncbi:uncharacterized protein LOC135940609 [Cloeon dipterum]|uniref:uncharacterized protein LOC135940609 n=1 Tax=Cloeon dipterum TaxID=197152 RepID=UPI00322048FC